MRILIADDEPFARQRLSMLLRSEPDVEIVAECVNGEEAVELASREPLDLVLLDINMPGLDGFQTMAKVVGGELPLVVFITAFDQHALRAFEVRAFDYLLKPFDSARLKQTIQRARVQLQRMKQETGNQKVLAMLENMQGKPARDRFAIKNGGRIYFLSANDVDWIEAEHNYVRIHASGEAHMLRERLSALEQELDSRRFRRIHRSAIVNIDRIRELQPWFRGDYVVILQNGQQLTMSRTFRENLKDLLG